MIKKMPGRAGSSIQALHTTTREIIIKLTDCKEEKGTLTTAGSKTLEIKGRGTHQIYGAVKVVPQIGGTCSRLDN